MSHSSDLWNEATRTRVRFASAAFSLLLFAFSACAQLPPNQKLSAEDESEFNQELQRLEKLLLTANDKGAIELQIAKTYAAGGQFSEAIRRLRRVIEENLGFDPSRDPDFAKVRDSAEFQSIMDQVRRQTPPVHHSRLITTLGERNIRPESIAFDIQRNAVLLGNTARFEVVRCFPNLHCFPLVTPNPGEKDYVLGIKIDRNAGTLWATYNRNGSAGLRCYDLKTGKLRRAVSIEGKHMFNDLAISSTGNIYVSDTAADSVYQLTSGTVALERVAPQHTFTAANGIAISSDGRLLYVSTWEDGIAAVNLQSGVVTPIIHPDDVCLAFIDGLYATQGNLIAIQNGPMLPRIVEFRLGENRLKIVAMRVLERRNPAFDGITTGVIVGNDLYYVANPQTDKKNGAELRPLQIFSVRIDP